MEFAHGKSENARQAAGGLDHHQEYGGRHRLSRCIRHRDRKQERLFNRPSDFAAVHLAAVVGASPAEIPGCPGQAAGPENRADSGTGETRSAREVYAWRQSHLLPNDRPHGLRDRDGRGRHAPLLQGLVGGPAQGRDDAMRPTHHPGPVPQHPRPVLFRRGQAVPPAARAAPAGQFREEILEYRTVSFVLKL